MDAEAEALLDKAQKAFVAHDYGAALKLLDKVPVSLDGRQQGGRVSLERTHARVHRGRAACLASLKDFGSAADAAAQSVHIEPQSATGQAQLAACLILLGRHHDALYPAQCAVSITSETSGASEHAAGDTVAAVQSAIAALTTRRAEAPAFVETTLSHLRESRGPFEAKAASATVAATAAKEKRRAVAAAAPPPEAEVLSAVAAAAKAAARKSSAIAEAFRAGKVLLAFEALGKECMTCSTSRAAVVGAGATEAVVGSLRDFEGYGDIQMAGFRALRLMALRDSALALRGAACGAVRAAGRCLSVHAAHEAWHEGAAAEALWLVRAYAMVHIGLFDVAVDDLTHAAAVPVPIEAPTNYLSGGRRRPAQEGASDVTRSASAGSAEKGELFPTAPFGASGGAKAQGRQGRDVEEAPNDDFAAGRAAIATSTIALPRAEDSSRVPHGSSGVRQRSRQLSDKGKENSDAVALQWRQVDPLLLACCGEWAAGADLRGFASRADLEALRRGAAAARATAAMLGTPRAAAIVAKATFVESMIRNRRPTVSCHSNHSDFFFLFPGLALSSFVSCDCLGNCSDERYRSPAHS